MSDDHSARSGSLHAHLQAVTMEIDDDDERLIELSRKLTIENVEKIKVPTEKKSQNKAIIYISIVLFAAVVIYLIS